MENVTYSVRPEQKQLFEDFRTTAQALEVPFNEPAVAAVFDTYNQVLISDTPRSLFMYRLTTKAERNVSLRYIDYEVPHDALALALESGLIIPEGHPVEDLIPQLQEKGDVFGFGVDLTALRGIEKIWPFCRPITIDEVLEIPAVPEAARDLRDFYTKYDLRWITVLAADFLNKSMNIYFPVNVPGRYSPEELVELVTDLGFVRPSDEDLQAITNCLAIYITFDWESMDPLRICFTTNVMDPDGVKDMHPMFEPLMTEAPVKTEAKMFNLAPTYGKDFAYYKLESDYNGLLLPILAPLLQIPA